MLCGSAILLPWHSSASWDPCPCCAESCPSYSPGLGSPPGPAVPLPRALPAAHTPSGSRLRLSAAAWASARAGEWCQGWEETPRAVLLLATGICVPSSTNTAPGDFPLWCLLVAWEKSLMEDPASLGEALARMGSKMGGQSRSVLRPVAVGDETGPPCCPTLPSLQPTSVAHTAATLQRRACVSLRRHVWPGGTALGTDKGSIAGSSYFGCRSRGCCASLCHGCT